MMDMSFAGQLMALISLAEGKFPKENDVFMLPYSIDMDIANVKLAAMGIEIDELTEEQVKYATAYDEGT